jgi:hypothetical protein
MGIGKDWWLSKGKKKPYCDRHFSRQIPRDIFSAYSRSYSIIMLEAVDCRYRRFAFLLFHSAILRCRHPTASLQVSWLKPTSVIRLPHQTKH